MRAVLRRLRSTDQGTFGTLEVAGQLFHTGEPPERGNLQGLSCIPAGDYTARWGISPRFGECYKVLNVPDRTEVLFHAGNWCGDRAKGLKTDTEACVLLGLARGLLEGQEAVIASKSALQSFHALTRGYDLQLTIIDEYLEAGEPEVPKTVA